MDLQNMASVGSVIEAEVKTPVPGTLRLRLDTPESCAAANDLLMDKNSGWRLANAVQQD